MSSAVKIVVALALVALTVFLGPLVGILSGAFIGWVVGHFFPGTLDVVSTVLTGDALPHWQLGAALGFVGGFFRNKVSVSKD